MVRGTAETENRLQSCAPDDNGRLPEGCFEAEVCRYEASSFFQNTACEYFPCHEGVPEADFNCMFCYCPLYVLGRECGGACTYTEQGIKDCSACNALHYGVEGIARIKAKWPSISELAAVFASE